MTNTMACCWALAGPVCLQEMNTSPSLVEQQKLFWRLLSPYWKVSKVFFCLNNLQQSPTG